MHLLPMEWVKNTISSNKRIIGLVAGLVPDEEKCGLALVLMINDGSSILGFEIIDYDETILNSGNISSDDPKYDGGPKPDAIMSPTQYIDLVVHDTSNNTIRIIGYNDISFL